MLERATRFMEEKSTDGGSWAANNQLLGGNAGLASASVNTPWMLKKSCSMALSTFMFPPYHKLLSDQWETVTLLCWAGYVGFVPSLTLVGELFNTVVSFSNAKWMRLREICSVVGYSLQTGISQWKEIGYAKEIGCTNPFVLHPSRQFPLWDTCRRPIIILSPSTQPWSMGYIAHLSPILRDVYSGMFLAL